MASTDKGIVYPTSGDNIAPLETHFASLAQSADDAIADLKVITDSTQVQLDDLEFNLGVLPLSASFAFTGPADNTTPVDFTVTFPGGYFGSPPVVVATVQGTTTSSGYFATLHGITASQFQVRVWRLSGTTAQSLTLQWIAK